MSFLDEIKARTKRGPGSVDVWFGNDDAPVSVPLKYPKAAAQAEFVAFIDAMDDGAKGSDAIAQNEKLINLSVKLCVVGGDEMDDDDLLVLVRESGGATGALAMRCSQLLGLGSGPVDRQSRVVKKKRGR